MIAFQFKEENDNDTIKNGLPEEAKDVVKP